jgi:hypothetical protein
VKRPAVLKSVVALLPLVLAACSTEPVLSEQQYYDSAATAMQKESYDVAIQDYQKLLE